jgi:hypothetical protein
VIAVREGSKSSTLFKDAAVKLKAVKKPDWLTFDDAAVTAKVSGDPKNPDPFLNFQVVIEFYSR